MEDREGRGDIASAMHEAGIAHIGIESIDYDLFYLTEETEILALESPPQNAFTDIWHEFIGNLFSEQRVDKTRRDRIVRMKPSELAAEINDRKIDLAITLQNYQRIFSEASRPEIPNRPDTRLRTLLKNLQPELRQQFLSITFDAVAKGADEFLKNYSNDVVIEMLHHANSQNKQLSPSLINLLEKLSHTPGSMPLNPQQMGIDDSDADLAVAKEYLQKLLKREPYENYVDKSYSALLHRLSKEAFQSGQLHHKTSSETVRDDPRLVSETVAGPTVSESYRDVFDPAYLDLRITHMSLALLDQDLAIEDYTGFAEKLVMRAGHFIEIGTYDVVLMMIQTFQRHAQEKSAAFQLVAQECLRKLTISDIPTRVLQMLQDGSEDRVDVASDILSAFGKAAIPAIMNLYIDEASSIGSRAMFRVLKAFGTDSLEEAYTRLHDSRIAVLRKMLAFIRKIGSRASIGHIRSLISHDDPLVRLDVLTALLHFQDPGAAAFLRCSLQSGDPLECLGAVQLSGYYRVGEVANDLIELLIKSPWRRADYRKNVTIIKSLGKIGDPGALPVLEKFTGKALAVYPDELRKMKIAVFESLSGYSRERISRILTIGEQSDDYRIRDICKTLT
jgi:HEAT repeat protein